MEYRNEYKQEINFSDMVSLRQRLGAVCKRDKHCPEGSYTVRSLYFDNLYDKALLEKINGVNKREKFRIRAYNNDFSSIFLEKKSKVNGLSMKDRVELSQEEVNRILNNDFYFMLNSDKALVKEFYFKIQTQCLRPKCIVEYTREPFVYFAGNVRVTLDYNIRTAMSSVDFLNPDLVTVPAGSTGSILEVKWDEFLPNVIRDVVQLQGRRTNAFSKYAASRIYG